MSFLSAPDDAKQGGELGWVFAGVTLFAFAAPSAVQSAPYFIGGTGFNGGTIFCLLNTLFSIAGSWMLLQVKLQFPSAHSFGDLGFKVAGPVGRACGNFIQIGNFLLFLPCALLFTGQALEGIGKWSAPFIQDNFVPCWDYFIFIIAVICFLTTQARTLSNSAIFACISTFSVLMMGIIQLYACFKYDVKDKQPAQMFGNPDENSVLFLTQTAGIAVFGYVPSFLTAELASCMKSPSEMTKSLTLSGVLNIIMMLGVGIPVVARWGYNMGNVIGVTGTPARPGTAIIDAWGENMATTNILNIFALIGNFVSYMLDSVPLGRWMQQQFAPGFADTWSCGDITKYVLYTLPAWLFGLVMAIFFPSLEFLIEVVTFMTTPWVTMVYPAVLYYMLFAKGDPSLLDGAPQKAMPAEKKLLVVCTFLFGILGFVISIYSCIRKLMVEGVADWQIGCQGWLILAPKE
jgi:hypothetical protein